MVAGFIAGLISANAFEWYMHKNFLHKHARKKNSFWRFHWVEHHKNVIKQDFRDADYEHNWMGQWDAQSKEVVSLIGAAAIATPLLPVAPGFTAALYLSAWNYYRVHKKAHLDPEWGYRYLPWHYDHHMGPDQEKNWCVTFPLWDHIMGTRVPYKGTEQEAKDIARGRRRPPVAEENTQPPKLRKVA